MPIVISVIAFALIVFALVDLIMSDDWQVKHLPKLVWLLVIIFLPLIGSIVWLAVGKDRAVARPATALSQSGRHEPGRPQPSRHEPLPYESTTEAELAALEREIAFHEKQAEVKRLEALVEEKRRGKAQGPSTQGPSTQS